MRSQPRVVQLTPVDYVPVRPHHFQAYVRGDGMLRTCAACGRHLPAEAWIYQRDHIDYPLCGDCHLTLWRRPVRR